MSFNCIAMVEGVLTTHFAQDERAAATRPTWPAVLNLDVLYLIMSHVSQKSSLLAIMCTCHALHRAGIPLLLEEVYLTSWSLPRFCGYMLKDLSILRPINSLTVSLSSQHLSVSATNQLVSVLQHSQDLECLCMIGGDMDRRLTTAISSLKNLKSISLRTAANDEDILLLLKTMHSRPIRLDIMLRLSEETAVDAISAFSELAPSVREIIAGRVRFAEASTMYPHVRKLVATYCSYINPAAMAHAYPNLESLELELVQDTVENGSEDVKRRLRDRNRYSQVERPRWVSLETLKGSTHSLYTLSLTCQVRNLEVTERLYLPHGVSNLAAVVSDAKPLRLKISVSAHTLSDMESLAGVFEMALAHLRHLTVDVSDSVCHSIGVQQLLRSFLGVIRTLNISYLEFSFPGRTTMCMNLRALYGQEPMFNSCLGTSGDQGFAQQVADFVLSVRYLVLHFPRELSSFWRMESYVYGVDRVPIQLSNDEGLRVMRRSTQEVYSSAG